ncbi:MAG: hypothetical protein H7A39_01620 [Chlamydiales bacterium]|nr:hypothetical protein [Chlamydiales bacterium]
MKRVTDVDRIMCKRERAKLLSGIKKWRSGRKLRQGADQVVAGYVLITCCQPDAKGEMQVEMTYEGDKVLASYLLESAKSVFDEE